MNSTSQPRRALRPAVVGVLLTVVLAAFVPWLLHFGRPPAAISFPDADPAPTAAGDLGASAPAVAPAAEALPAKRSSLEESGGIQVSRVALAHGGTALSIRYTIIASNKATELHDQAAEAYLVDQTGQTRLSLGSPAAVGALSGHSRARSMMASMTDARGFPPAPNRLQEGECYSLLIPNPRGAIKAGDTVSLVVGTLYVENLTVEPPRAP